MELLHLHLSPQMAPQGRRGARMGPCGARLLPPVLQPELAARFSAQQSQEGPLGCGYWGPPCAGMGVPSGGGILEICRSFFVFKWDHS